MAERYIDCPNCGEPLGGERADCPHCGNVFHEGTEASITGSTDPAARNSGKANMAKAGIGCLLVLALIVLLGLIL